MNTRSQLPGPSYTAVHSVSFSDNQQCFAIGMKTGFCAYSSSECEPQIVKNPMGGVGLVQCLGLSYLFGLVGGGKSARFPPNKLLVWNDRTNKLVLEITAMSQIRGMRLNPDRIAIVLKNNVRVYKLANNPDLLASYETSDNLFGLAAMNDSMIAFPGRTPGQVQMVDFASSNVSIVPAHSASLVAMCLSRDGMLLATASDKGTIIRIFSTSSGARLAELRRGWDNALIYSLCFSPSGAMLACTSDKGTLHLYDVPHPNLPAQTTSAGGSDAPTPASPKGTPGYSTAPTATASAAKPGPVSTVSYPSGRAGTAYDAGPGESSSTYSYSPSFSSSNRGPASPPGSSSGGPESSGADGKNKWGILGKIPLMPRYFSDVVSFTQANFSMDEPDSPTPAAEIFRHGPIHRPSKGIIGWLDEDTLVTVGAGLDPRWERFSIAKGQDGKRHCTRNGWKKILGGNEPPPLKDVAP